MAIPTTATFVEPKKVFASVQAMKICAFDAEFNILTLNIHLSPVASLERCCAMGISNQRGENVELYLKIA